LIEHPLLGCGVAAVWRDQLVALIESAGGLSSRQRLRRDHPLFTIHGRKHGGFNRQELVNSNAAIREFLNNILKTE
jgi:hypothetical protein